MQLRLVPWLLLALLYWASVPFAIQPAAAQEEPSRPDGVLLTQPHIAIILPLQSVSFGKHADSVRLGVFAAAGLQQDALPVVVYATTEEPARILDAYRRAISTGALAAIGPLTRNGVSSLASSGQVLVPTIALNAPETDIRLPPQLYVFGLQIESEARQVARYALKQGGKSVFVVMRDAALDRRIAQAFTDEWRRLRGTIAEQFVYTTEVAALAKLRERLATTSADTIFLTVDAARARFARPYLGSRQSIYATSLVFASNADPLELYDLDGVRFLDMPWLLQPDHPAVMSYLRPEIQTRALDQERFYALGIDAYRIARALLDDPGWRGPLDGVTGTIALEAGQHFSRALVPAQFVGGTVRPLHAAPQ
ncbi:MAG TPA: penicillin-binding protein activator [Burkholderiales bacterium]|jgi:outer membrane PBP1 activator LpoA protein|nr:penicillin-binding protein activator [Burkholderiales bacterium]